MLDKTDNKIKITVIGIREIDVIYSGYETFVRKIIRYSNLNRFSYYFCVRKNYKSRLKKLKEYSLVSIPTVKNKYFETILYSFFATLHSIVKDTEIILFLGLSNAFFLYLLKLARKKVIVNVDGLDWQRKRWNKFGKLYLKLCESITIRFADFIVCDSKTIYKYYNEKYGHRIDNLIYIPYGASVHVRKPGRILEKFKLKPYRYIHFVGRLTPENCVEDLILAFKSTHTNYKCVIIGDSVYEDRYKKYLKEIAQTDDRIIFTGFLKGTSYEEICSNSGLYVETKSAGGTHPSLLEAIAFGNFVIAKDKGEIQEVLKANFWLYSNQSGYKSLRSYLKKYFKQKVINCSIHKRIRTINHKHIIANYKWQNIMDDYENLFLHLNQSRP